MRSNDGLVSFELLDHQVVVLGPVLVVQRDGPDGFLLFDRSGGVGERAVVDGARWREGPAGEGAVLGLGRLPALARFEERLFGAHGQGRFACTNSMERCWGYASCATPSQSWLAQKTRLHGALHSAYLRISLI